MNEKGYLVQFLHPGAEYDMGDKVQQNESIEMAWNTGEHKRKFIANEGSYVESTRMDPIDGKIMFHGEWEPESLVSKLPIHPNKYYPKYLHRPLIRKVSKVANLQNTDPYVFGECFHYCCCQQMKKVKNMDEYRSTKLQELTPLSIILFGSYKKIDEQGEFVLDTVMVVKESFPYCKSTIRELKGEVSDTYYKAVLKRVVDGNTNELVCESNNEELETASTCKKTSHEQEVEFTLYNGVSYKEREQYQGIFSFFPCLPYNEEKGFAKPIIRFSEEEMAKYKLVFNSNKTTGFGCTHNLTETDLKTLWTNIANQVTEQGLCLGIYTEEPVFK